MDLQPTYPGWGSHGYGHDCFFGESTHTTKTKNNNQPKATTKINNQPASRVGQENGKWKMENGKWELNQPDRNKT